MKKILKIVGANFLVFFVLLLIAESIGQIIALVRPSYEVLFFEPDETTGWKQVPNLRWPWTGQFWYAADFSVMIDTNPLGFRDKPREPSKPQGIRRVALMGDSFIEAVQVPFAKTGGQILEQKLNDRHEEKQNKAERWEVLNFGISNYGVGQYLLAWEKYASEHHPDYVLIFVANFHMERTFERHEYPTSNINKDEKLWVRPTFRMEKGALIREPAKDFDRFVEAQKILINTKFAEKRIRKKPMRILTLYYARRVWQGIRSQTARFCPSADATVSSSKKSFEHSEILITNLKIMEELGLKVREKGGIFVVMDASQYFGDDEIISVTLSKFCNKHGFGYIPIYEDLLQANKNGISTRWAHDGHFNETGNKILAGTIHHWIEQSSQTIKLPK